MNCAHNKSQQVSTLLFNEACDSAQNFTLFNLRLTKNAVGKTGKGQIARF